MIDPQERGTSLEQPLCRCVEFLAALMKVKAHGPRRTTNEEIINITAAVQLGKEKKWTMNTNRSALTNGLVFGHGRLCRYTWSRQT